MKKLVCLSFLLFFAINLSKAQDNNATFVGTWKLEFNDQGNSSKTSTTPYTYELKSNGNYSISNGNQEIFKGSWVYDNQNNSLSFNPENGGKAEFKVINIFSTKITMKKGNNDAYLVKASSINNSKSVSN